MKGSHLERPCREEPVRERDRVLRTGGQCVDRIGFLLCGADRSACCLSLRLFPRHVRWNEGPEQGTERENLHLVWITTSQEIIPPILPSQCCPMQTTGTRKLIGLRCSDLYIWLGSCHKRQKPQAPTPQAPIRNRQTRKVANAKGLNRNTNLT